MASAVRERLCACSIPTQDPDAATGDALTVRCPPIVRVVVRIDDEGRPFVSSAAFEASQLGLLVRAAPRDAVGLVALACAERTEFAVRDLLAVGRQAGRADACGRRASSIPTIRRCARLRAKLCATAMRSPSAAPPPSKSSPSACATMSATPAITESTSCCWSSSSPTPVMVGAGSSPAAAASSASPSSALATAAPVWACIRTPATSDGSVARSTATSAALVARRACRSICRCRSPCSAMRAATSCRAGGAGAPCSS